MKTAWIGILLFVSQLSTQTQKPGNGALQGKVVGVSSTLPLSNATVELRTEAGGETGFRTASGGDGSFLFPVVPLGAYRVIATKSGFIKTEYGQRRPDAPGFAIRVAEGEKVNGLQLAMIPGGVISGRITDRGKPVGGAVVKALVAVYRNGRRILMPSLDTLTDDRGEYSLFWLPPGHYYVEVNVADAGPARLPASQPLNRGEPFFTQQVYMRPVLNRPIGSGAPDNVSHVPTYFPHDVAWQSAFELEIKPGEKLRNIDIDCPPVPVHNVRGSVFGIAATPAPPTGLRGAAAPQASGNAPSARPNVKLIGSDSVERPGSLDQGGSFSFSRIPDGSYTLYASLGDLAGLARVEVGGADVTGLNVTLTPAPKISGRIFIETPPDSGNPVAGLGALSLTLRAQRGAPEYSVNQLNQPNRSGGSDFATIRAEDSVRGSFVVSAMQPGDYEVIVHPLMAPSATNPPAQIIPALRNAYLRMQNSYVKSIRYGEADVLSNGLHVIGTSDATLEIVIGTNPGILEGRVVDAQKQAVAAAAVALIPEGPLRFRANHKFTYTDDSGRYRLQGLAPGDYDVYAWEAIEKDAWQDPERMRSYQGKRVHIDEGRKTNLDDIMAAPAQP